MVLEERGLECDDIPGPADTGLMTFCGAASARLRPGRVGIAPE
jgi:hypothetical protein